jgi:hypothetical protein
VRKCVWRIKCVFAGNAYGFGGGPGGGVRILVSRGGCESILSRIVVLYIATHMLGGFVSELSILGHIIPYRISLTMPLYI